MNGFLGAAGGGVLGSLAGYRFVGERWITATTNFDKNDAMGDGSKVRARALIVQVVGGGGSGGGVSSSGGTPNASRRGGGGGGGGYAVSFFKEADVDALPVPVVCTVGGGGSGAPVAGSGNAGGTSSFGTLMTANGGNGGVLGSTSAGGAAGTASGGNLRNITGSFGGDGNTGNDGLTGDGGGSFLSHRTGSDNHYYGTIRFRSAIFPGGGSSGTGSTAAGFYGSLTAAAGVIIIDVFI